MNYIDNDGDEPRIDSALDFLVNASRVSPVLREKVRIVDDAISRLRLENEQLRVDLAAAYCRMDDMEGYNDE